VVLSALSLRWVTVGLEEIVPNFSFFSGKSMPPVMVRKALWRCGLNRM